MGTEKPPPARRPTIRDVAEKAGVSKSLVSLVIHDSPRVSDKSRTAVQSAIDELGYRPSAMARGLVNQQSGLVGIVMSNAHDIFYAEVLEGLTDYLTEHQAGMIPLILHGSHEEELEARAVAQCLELRTECVMLMGSALPEEALDRIAEEVPLATVGRWVDSDNIDVVVNDDRRGAELATKHLVDLGHRDITHISGGNGNGAQEREAGYRGVMEQAGHEPTVIAGGYLIANGTQAGSQLLERPTDMPTAVVAANDLAAIGLIDVIRKAGLRVPDDVSVVGYDDLVLAGLEPVSLTTINQPTRQMGETVARIVCQRIRDQKHEPQKVLLEPELVVRSTTRPMS